MTTVFSKIIITSQWKIINNLFPTSLQCPSSPRPGWRLGGRGVGHRGGEGEVRRGEEGRNGDGQVQDG